MLTWALLQGIMPRTVLLPVRAEGTETVTNPLAGKTISILGDSISTYTGVSNDANANASLAGGAIYYTPGKQGVYQADTWWQQVIDSLDMELCVNNSWSGSAVLPTRSGTAGGYRDRCVQLHNAAGEEPDIIAVFLGTNDFSYHQGTLGTADIDYEALITDNADGTFTYASPVTTCEAYAIMLHKMTVRYPDAEIYCMTLLPRRDPDKEDSYADVGQPTEFNAALKEVISHFGCTVVDLENCGIDKAAENFDQYITDQRVHPGPAGMDKITEALISAILGKQTKLYSISGVYTGVQTDNAAAAAAEGMGYTANIAMMEGYSDLRVTITMGGEDITDSAYDNGRIHISAVTGDIVITAAAAKTAADYRWEFSGSSVSSITTDGNKANVLTLLGGSISDGILKNAYFRMAEQVVLYHDRPWAVEWSAAGSWSGMLLSKSQTSSASGNEYFFKSNSTDIGLIAFGQRQNEQYMNYGIKLADHGVDTALRHIYRLENHIADDGSNAVHLLVDGVDYGAMTRHYISTTDQGSDKNWANGRDLTFDYIGANGHMINNCDLDYIQVWEDGELEESLPLRYDDHYDVTGKTVDIVDAGKPTSYQVGYGVAENSVLDTAVVTLEGNKLIATGIGTAKVRIDGQLYEVTVETAPISLLLLAGQSNMRGSEGNANQSIVCPDGMVYSTYGDDRGADNTAMTVNNAAMFAPSALAGEYSTINSVGTTDCLSGYPVHSLTEAGAGKIGPDSGFAYEWAQQTGEKVWVVNAAHGGTSINVWQPGTKEYEECQALFTACTETLRKEIAAGHFTLNHMGYFWCQGCSDRAQSAKWYVDKYLAMHEALKTELAFDHDSDSTTADKTFEFGGIIPVRVGSTSKCYRDGVNTDSNPYAYHESFVDLRMSGPRVAQYWMGNNPELEDIWTVCTIGDDWVWMPDGTNGVSDYFNKHYANGTVDYQPQVAQSASWYTPTTPKAVHDSVHYNQIGYNEIGRESVRNALIMLGEKEDYAEETTVRFVDWTGYKEVTEITASPTAGSGTLVVPIISPVTRAKSVTFSTSNGLKWNYGDLTADTAGTNGTLSADGLGVSVNVVKAQPGQHYADHLSALPESYCANTDLWKLLEHDSQYYASGTNWGSHSSGQVYSVTIPVSAGDKIFATSFGKGGENGHTSTSGIRTTFFNAYGVAKTMTPAETYAEFSANGGYLIAPEGTTAVNVAMWTNGDENELYILSAEHKYVGGICSTCGAQHPALADWSGKVISIMGDSISTFAGYIPVADGFNLEHLPRYPQDDLLTDVNETWWMQVIAALDAKLGINDSWRGATLSGAAPVTTGTTGENAAMSNLIRIQNLGSNGSPDVILLYGGTNDLAHVADIGAFSPETAPTEADLTTTKWDNLADGFLYTILRIRHYYPNAVIIAMLPTFTKSYYSNEKLAQGNAVMAAICEHYGVPYVDLRHCGITTDDLPDGIHPDATGMDFITEAVLAALLEEDVEAGENVVYSVTHTLTGAKTSLGHYKGISAGAAFTETVTGDDLTVTVTMGGADITDTCYADGKITIPAVTGDLVITAKGKFSAYGHLQPLPERFCAGTNLWTALKHDEEYYTVSGWGIHSSGKVFSVTFPVSGGDQLYGTSFGKAGENGSSTNGIRVTYFYENGSVKSLSSAETYAEFAANGYLTVPENAVAVCVPMWTPEDSNELYVLTAEHAYESVVTPPTCTETGYTTHTCECGDSYVDSYVDARGHSYEATVTYPVGLTKGYTDYTCTSCAEAYRTAWLDPSAYEGKTIACIGDSITAAYGVTKDQTDYVYLLAKQLGMDYIRLGDSGTTLCTDGSRTCNIRRLTENNLQGADIVTIAMGINDFCAAAEGYYELGDINSTDGSTIYGAARMWCERIVELRKTDSLSHTQFYFVTPVITSWNNSVTSARDWDQSKENIHGYTLRDLCNAIIEVAALYDVPVIDLNLISGLYYNSADDNNIDVFGGDGVHPGVNGHAMMAAALANALLQNDLRDDHTHTYGSWITTKYPGCEDGEEKHVCSICTATESRALDATGHSYHSVVTDPTCTEGGYTAHICTACGDSYVDDYVDATGHSYGEWYEVDAPACSTAGEDRRDCDDCDHYETRVVDALGHDLKQHEAKEPTCTAVGWKDYETCSRCDYSTYEEIPATVHNHAAEVTPPTCTEQGYTTYTCHCGDSYVDSYVDALGHDYEAVITEPTYTEAGYTTYTCTVCGSSYVGDHTDPLLYLKGDLDGNEVTNTDDAIYLLYHAFFGEELYPVNQPCDFDANGSVNTDDAIYLLYHAFFGEQLYPLH